MANEAVLFYETHQPIQMTCANGTGIEKGALLSLSDPMTATGASVSTAAHAGIAHSEKIANDGITKLSVYRGGIFKVTALGPVTVGEGVVFEADNKVSAMATGQTQRGGIALETAADGETFLMELAPAHRVIA